MSEMTYGELVEKSFDKFAKMQAELSSLRAELEDLKCQASTSTCGISSSAQAPLQSGSQWMPAATAPSYPILGWCRVPHVKYEGPSVIWREDGKWHGGPSGLIDFEVLAWQELPSPPLKSQIEEQAAEPRSDDDSPRAEQLPDTLSDL